MTKLTFVTFLISVLVLPAVGCGQQARATATAERTTPAPAVTPVSTPLPTAGPTPQPTATPVPAAVQEPPPEPMTTPEPTPDPVQREKAQVCLIEALSQQELVELASGKVPLLSTLIKVGECDAAIEGLGASFPLSVEQMECLKLYGGDDAFQAIAGGADVPKMIAEAMARCEIDIGVLEGTATGS